VSPALKLQRNQLHDEQEMWEAVASRNPEFDGEFVFAVESTGIYCRPSCPSRRPRRDRVSFFPLPELAEQSGFRACLRCHPKQVRTVDPQIEMVRKACRYIEEHNEETVNLEALGKHVGLSSFYLQRTFKALMGITPRQYAESCRTNRFKTSVRGGESVTNAMYDAGYGSSSRLYERSNAELGMTPATYSRAGRDMRISYTIARSPLGFLLVAATDKGICTVKLGDTASELDQDFRSEFAEAEISESDDKLAGAIEQILKHIAGRQPRLELPLDIRATAFQRQVWEALRSIPYGVTKSYGDIAKEIGQPKAVRAVARACATNPVALVIPCHRVIREDKSLGGYRWGIERKKKLLARESSKTDEPQDRRLPF